ncbi:hypothetical protein EAI_02949 [Harpegnathos saltator]|uniref:Uncharacterized protein n=1 Tax=Harpegnathos saltator TaxID=610380 RepID=E2BVN3_HARSA|nr:hypothetical protein EAI_02949 [Harpegnathos saltator]
MIVDSGLARPLRVVNPNQETRAALVTKTFTSAKVKRPPSFRTACLSGLNGLQSASVLRTVETHESFELLSCRRRLSCSWAISQGLADAWTESSEFSKKRSPEVLNGRSKVHSFHTEAIKFAPESWQRGDLKAKVDSHRKASTQQGVLVPPSAQQILYCIGSNLYYTRNLH